MRVLPCDKEKTSGFRHEELLEGLLKTDEREQLREVKIVETPEQTHPRINQRLHGEPLLCRAADIPTLPIYTVHFINCIIEDRLPIAFLRGSEGLFPVQLPYDRVEELRLL